MSVKQFDCLHSDCDHLDVMTPVTFAFFFIILVYHGDGDTVVIVGQRLR